MHRFFHIFAMMFALTVFIAAATGAEKIWVSVKSAPLKAEKSASSETITTLPTGTELAVVSAEGRWYRVTGPSGNEGWIFRGKVSKTPPQAEESLEDDLMGDLDSSGIILAAADTSRSIRGKNPEKPDYKSKIEIEEKYVDALERVMSFYVGDEEINDFLKQGAIGEYAE